MRSKKIQLSGMMFAGLIIVISFVYAINVQPVVFGKSCSSIPSQRSNQFDSYNDFNDFFYKSSFRFSIYHGNSLIRSRDILISEDESKILHKIPYLYNLPDTYLKIFELNDFVEPVISYDLSEKNIIYLD